MDYSVANNQQDDMHKIHRSYNHKHHTGISTYSLLQSNTAIARIVKRRKVDGISIQRDHRRRVTAIQTNNVTYYFYPSNH